MTKKPIEIISENMQRLRRLKKLTQEELAYRVGIDSSYVAFIEQKKRTPSLQCLDKIAKALGVSLEDLLSSGPLKKRAKKAQLANECVQILQPLTEHQAEVLVKIIRANASVLLNEMDEPKLRVTEKRAACRLKKEKRREKSKGKD